MTAVRLMCTQRNWVRAEITLGPKLDADVWAAVQDLRDVPGVGYSDSDDRVVVLQLPATVWMLPAFTVLLGEQLQFVQLLPRTYGAPLWQPKRPLFAYQAEGARTLVDAGGGFLMDDMGLGKSSTAIVTIETMVRAEGILGARVIVAPRFTRTTWRRELVALGAIATGDELACFEGQDSSAPPAHWEAAKWWFIHYDVACYWSGWMMYRRPAAVILDESHWIRNGRAARSKAVSVIAGLATVRLPLTGTPMPNRTAELHAQLAALDGPATWGHPLAFRIRYCGAVHDGHGYKDGEPTNVAELQRRLEGRSVRRTAEDVGLGLPELTRQTVSVTLTETARGRHDGLVAATGGAAALVRQLRAQSCGRRTLELHGQLRTLTSRAKIPTTVQLVAGMLAQRESVLVFTWRRDVAQRLASLIAPFLDDGRECLAIDGDWDQDDRDLAIDAFQVRGGVLVATMGVLREGVTLTRARHVVMHDLDLVPATILQCEKRIHRIGQAVGCTSTWVLADNSFDTILARLLVLKGVEIGTVLAQPETEDALDVLGLDAAQLHADALAEDIAMWRSGAREAAA